MDHFISVYEELRQTFYPRNWSYQIDRHTASVFRALTYPDIDYIFKSKDAGIMAKYTEFGFSIGSGRTFSLENYYRLCDEIVEALKEHDSLLEKHFNALSDACYNDTSLHLLAFDLQYCCKTYGYYDGLGLPTPQKKTISKSKAKPKKETVNQEELERRQELRREKEIELQHARNNLEEAMDECADISLVNIQVLMPKYGQGIVIEQNINKIKVQFDAVQKLFVLDDKYRVRPQFEDDEIVISTFSR